MIDGEALARAGTGLQDRFGPEAAAQFGAELPDRLRALAEEWGIEVGPLIDTGASALVLEAQLGSGESGVVKISPDAGALAQQVWMLEHLAPTGRVPAVYTAAAGAVLMERVLPGQEVGADRQGPPTVAEWADLLQDLHSTPTAAVTESLDDRCADMFDRIGARQRAEAVRTQVCDVMWGRTVDLCRKLLAARTHQAVIHGDLHLGNVLTSDERGLVAVDPKLCVGDRCFDMVDFVAVAGDAEQMTARAMRLAALTGVGTDVLLAWSAVNAVVTAISLLTWDAESQRSRELLVFADRHLG